MALFNDNYVHIITSLYLQSSPDVRSVVSFSDASRACGRLNHPPSTSSLSDSTRALRRSSRSCLGLSAANLTPDQARLRRGHPHVKGTAQFARSVALLYRKSITRRLRIRRRDVKTSTDAVVTVLARMTDSSLLLSYAAAAAVPALNRNFGIAFIRRL